MKYKKAFVKFKFSQVDSSFAHPQVNHFFAVSHQEGEMALLNSPSDLTFPITIVFTPSPSNAKPTGHWSFLYLQIYRIGATFQDEIKDFEHSKYDFVEIMDVVFSAMDRVHF